MATYKKEENSLTENIPQLKAMKIAVDIPKLTDTSHLPSRFVNKEQTNKERSEELIIERSLRSWWHLNRLHFILGEALITPEETF